MKKAVLLLTAVAFVAAGLVISTYDGTSKETGSELGLEEAIMAPDGSNEQYLTNVAKYRKETDDKAAASSEPVGDLNRE